MGDDGVAQAPDVGHTGELAGASIAKQLVAFARRSLGRVIGPFAPRPVRHLHALDARTEGTLFGQLLDGPGSHARDLARVLREVVVRVHGAVARAEHSHQDAERLGMRRPLAPVTDRLAPEQRRYGDERALGGELTHPPRLVVDRARVDPCAREQLLHGALTFFGAHANEVRLQDRSPKFLFAPLPHGPPSAGRDARSAHRQ
jgi:hypothetical protein